MTDTITTTTQTDTAAADTRAFRDAASIRLQRAYGYPVADADRLAGIMAAERPDRHMATWLASRTRDIGRTTAERVYTWAERRLQQP